MEAQQFLNRTGTLPQALALDGKMIRDHMPADAGPTRRRQPPVSGGLRSKKGTPRCEQTAATALLEKIAALDEKTVTADPLHCQRKTARLIVEKGGDYLLQIKSNQPHLLAQAQALDALPNTPFLSRANPDTDGSKPATSMPSPSNP